AAWVTSTGRNWTGTTLGSEVAPCRKEIEGAPRVTLVLRRLGADDRLGLEQLVEPPRAEFAHVGHVEQLGRGGVDPGAVDVELPGVFHSGTPFRSGRDASLGKDGAAWHHALSLYTHGYGGDGSPGTLRLPESAIPAKPEGT